MIEKKNIFSEIPQKILDAKIHVLCITSIQCMFCQRIALVPKHIVSSWGIELHKLENVWR